MHRLSAPLGQVLSVALQLWQDRATLLKARAQAVSGTPGTPQGSPLAPQGAGAGNGEAQRGASLPHPTQRHLPLKIRILWMAAKVAVTLDSKSASCTPVLRKAPAEGLFSQ